MSRHRSRDALVAAARLYYVEGLSQQEAADRLGMTRSNLSRVLRAAREEGVVEFHIHDEVGRDLGLERQLQDRFGLPHTRVSQLDAEDRADGPVAQHAADLLTESIIGAKVIAVSWGSTVSTVVQALRPPQRPDLHVVQLVGGLTSFDPHVRTHDLVRELGRRLGAEYHYLNAPGVFDAADALRSLAAEQSIRDVLDLAGRADVALVGIGDPHHGSAQRLIYQLAPDQSRQQAFWDAEPAGDVCGRFFDAHGNLLEIDGVTDRVLAITARALHRIPLVIAVAVGEEKARAVVGALRGRFANALVCDETLARAVLSESE